MNKLRESREEEVCNAESLWSLLQTFPVDITDIIVTVHVSDLPPPSPSSCTITQSSDTCKVSESTSSGIHKESESTSSSDSFSRDNSLTRSSEVITSRPQFSRVLRSRTNSLSRDRKLSPSPLLHDIAIPPEHVYVRTSTEESDGSPLPLVHDETAPLPHIYVRTVSNEKDGQKPVQTVSNENDGQKPEVRRRKRGSGGLEIEELGVARPRGDGQQVGQQAISAAAISTAATPTARKPLWPNSAVSGEQSCPQGKRG